MSPPDRLAIERVAPTAVVLARGSLAAVVTLVLRHCGLRADTVRTAESAEDLIGRRPPVLLVVDTSIRPDAARLLALADPNAHAVLALVDLARGGSSLAAFADGADQVIRVPFTPDELAVRVATVLRRLRLPTSFTRNEPIDGLELSLDEYVHAGSRTIRLDPDLNSLLYLLAANAEHAVSRDDIRRLVWGVDARAPNTAVDRVCVRLGRTLAEARGSVRVEVDGSGARLRLGPTVPAT